MYRNTTARETSNVPMSRRNEAAIPNDHENRSENSIMGRSPNYGRNSNILIPDPYH
jgi:hypothetical protein